MILKLGKQHLELNLYKVCITYLTVWSKFGQSFLLCLYQAQISGERLQDHFPLVVNSHCQEGCS